MGFSQREAHRVSEKSTGPAGHLLYLLFPERLAEQGFTNAGKSSERRSASHEWAKNSVMAVRIIGTAKKLRDDRPHDADGEKIS